MTGINRNFAAIAAAKNERIAAADAAAEALSKKRRAVFIREYIATRSVVSSARAAGIQPWAAADVGVSMLSGLAVQRAIILGMPDGDERVEMAARWQLDPDTAAVIPEPVTLIERIAAARERLAIAKLEAAPSLLIITRPPPSRRALQRARIEAKATQLEGVSA